MSQLAVVLLSPPFKSCGWDLTAVPPRQLPAAQELVGARNLVHSMVKASHVGPARSSCAWRTARSTSFGALLLSAVVRQLVVVLLCLPFKSWSVLPS